MSALESYISGVIDFASNSILVVNRLYVVRCSIGKSVVLSTFGSRGDWY